MNCNQYKWAALAILATALAFTSCKDRLEEQEKTEDTAITFSAAIGSAPLTRAEMEESFVTEEGLVVSVQPWGAQAPQTRTVYAGKEPGATKERIEWTTGDKVGIFSPQANAIDRDEFFGEYWWKTYNPRKNLGNYSYADYEVIGGASTQETHKGTLKRDYGFYDLHWSDESSYDFYGLYPAGVGRYGFNFNSGSPKVRFSVLPSSQPLTPNMREYAYMWAYESSKPKYSNVCLTFYPLFTAYEIALTADESIAAKTLTKVSISSECDYLWGGFDAQFSNLFPKPSITVLTENSYGKEVAIEYLNTQLSTTSPTTFTLLTIPTDQTELTLSLTFSDNTVLKLTLKEKNTQTGEWDWYIVPACSKVHITSQVTGSVDDWEYVFSELSNVVAASGGDTGTLSSGFLSYKKRSASDTKYPVEYRLEYSTDGGNSWSSTKPAWLSAAPNSQQPGSVEGEVLSVTLSQNNSAAIAMTGDAHDELASEGRKKGTYVAPHDLSTYNVATGQEGSMSTANCYVVSGYGYYKFPLVYGNMIKQGSNNPSCVNGSFVDHKGDALDNPWILTVMDNYSIFVEPVILWSDAQGLVENVEIRGTGENGYMCFSVPKDNIRQGNALLALKQRNSNDIVWSWHIWITDEDLTQRAPGSNGYNFSMVNLGWCDSPTATSRVPSRECLVRAVQFESGEATEAVIYQRGYRYSTSGMGNNPYYQWGRKDPIQAASGQEDNFVKTYYMAQGYSFSTITSKMTLKESILNPLKRSYISNAGSGNWLNTNITTLWNNNENKTVYDPCPVGYMVPPQAAIETFNNSNYVLNYNNPPRGCTFGALFFPASGRRRADNPEHVGHIGAYWLNQNKSRPDNHNYANGFDTRVLPKTGMPDYWLDQPFDINNHAHKSVSFSIRPVAE